MIDMYITAIYWNRRKNKPTIEKFIKEIIEKLRHNSVIIFDLPIEMVEPILYRIQYHYYVEIPKEGEIDLGIYSDKEKWKEIAEKYKGSKVNIYLEWVKTRYYNIGRIFIKNDKKGGEYKNE